jgi:hypothetical protein
LQAVPVSICGDVIVDNIPQALGYDDERIHQVEWKAHVAVEIRKRKGRPALQCVACAARPGLGAEQSSEKQASHDESSVYLYVLVKTGHRFVFIFTLSFRTSSSNATAQKQR